MLGTSLGLTFSAIFGINQIITRRGVMRSSVNYMANISIFSGPLFFALVALVTGERFRIGQFTWVAVFYFALAGIVHFALGRTFGYRSLQLIGATRCNVVTGLNAIVSVGLAIAVLHERLTPLITLGFLLSMAGPLIMGMQEGNNGGAEVKPDVPGKHVDARTLCLGVP